jgi:hypothetical protein
MKKKRGRKPIYKTKAAVKAYQKRWYEENLDRLKKYMKNYYRTVTKPKILAAAVNPANPTESLNTLGVGALPLLENRVAALEKEVKDILLDLDECLKENKRLANLARWGKG